MIYKPCLVCGKNVKIGLNSPNECAICEDCKNVILKMKKKFKNNTIDDIPREYIIKFINDKNEVSYLTNVPHSAKYISPMEIANRMKFVSDEKVAHKYTRTRVRKICESIDELQKKGLCTFIVRAEGIKDGKVMMFKDYNKKGE